MHWVIQENLFHEDGMQELLRVLDRMNLPYSLVKVVPFSGEIIPDINPPNPVIAIGAYSMTKMARARGWVPGIWNNENFDFQVWGKKWGKHCLNYDCYIRRFDDIPEGMGKFPWFIRPVTDSKVFAGRVIDWEEYADWRRRVVELEEDDGSSLRGNTLVIVAEPQEIEREYRLWVIDQTVVTASQYKLGDRVIYGSNVDADVIDFGRRMAETWQPDRAFVLDIALTEDGLSIVEINTLNSAGLYAANVGKLVEAIEGMGY